MNIVIVGAGDLGYFLTKILLEEGHDVVVVEKDEDLAHAIADEFDIISIVDDATKENTLKDAGAVDADATVVLTGSDETNLVVGMLAKDIGAKKVAISLKKVSYSKEFIDRLKIDFVFHPQAASAAYLEQMLTKPDVLDLAFLSRGKAEIIEYKITEDSRFLGRRVKDISDENQSLIAIFGKGGELKLPKPSTFIKEGEKILMLTKKEEDEVI